MANFSFVDTIQQQIKFQLFPKIEADDEKPKSFKTQFRIFLSKSFFSSESFWFRSKRANERKTEDVDVDQLDEAPICWRANVWDLQKIIPDFEKSFQIHRNKAPGLNFVALPIVSRS